MFTEKIFTCTCTTRSLLKRNCRQKGCLGPLLHVCYRGFDDTWFWKGRESQTTIYKQATNLLALYGVSISMSSHITISLFLYVSLLKIEPRRTKHLKRRETLQKHVYTSWTGGFDIAARGMVSFRTTSTFPFANMSLDRWASRGEHPSSSATSQFTRIKLATCFSSFKFNPFNSIPAASFSPVFF